MAKILKKVVTYYDFYCPGCKHRHVYIVKDDASEWEFNGNIESPTFKPSLLNRIPIKNELTGVYDSEKERCHLYVTNGKIEYQPDCFHELAGKTIDLPEI